MRTVTYKNRRKKDSYITIPVEKNGDPVKTRKGFINLGKSQYMGSKIINEDILYRDFERVS